MGSGAFGLLILTLLNGFIIRVKGSRQGTDRILKNTRDARETALEKICSSPEEAGVGVGDIGMTTFLLEGPRNAQNTLREIHTSDPI